MMASCAGCATMAVVEERNAVAAFHWVARVWNCRARVVGSMVSVGDAKVILRSFHTEAGGLPPGQNHFHSTAPRPIKATPALRVPGAGFSKPPLPARFGGV